MRKILTLFLLLSFSDAVQSQSLNCGSFCVLNIYGLDTASNEINVSILNADSNSVNYPTVIMTNLMGDTIANIDGNFYFFAHLPGDTLVHTISTTLDTIPDSCIVYYTDQIYDSTCIMLFPSACIATSLTERSVPDDFIMFPNPASNFVSFKNLQTKNIKSLCIFDSKGILVRSLINYEEQISLQDFSSGLYFVRLETPKGFVYRKLIVSK